MELAFLASLAESYSSGPQKIRKLSEHWVGQNVYCPSCGKADLDAYPNNRPVADFFCLQCREDYELKSQSANFGSRVVDGAYKTMIERLAARNNPNLLLLHYKKVDLSILDLLLIPKYYFVPAMIERRSPLAASAHRAGWTGCNILLSSVPLAGRIFLIRNRVWEPRSEVIAQWQKTHFLDSQKDLGAKGWLLAVMRCIERLRQPSFTLNDLYRFESELQNQFPSNQHIKEKIRQKLQLLRDKGYIVFAGKGQYRMT